MDGIGTLVTYKYIDKFGLRSILLRFIPGIIIALKMVALGILWATY
jgi:hypothetical protein